MSGCCSPFQGAAEQQFNAKKAAKELARYRTKGPGPTARLLLSGIDQSGALDGRVLDIGSGIGSLAFELLERGMSGAVAVDASSAYTAAARQEAERRGRADAVECVYADFVAVASGLPQVAVVTLDRVVCCYPSCEPLLDAALRHADRCLALSYPRDVWYVRLANRLENAHRRLRRNAFRTFVHPVSRMDEMIREAGFELSARRESWIWSADVYLRRQGSSSRVAHANS
jgi:magnesium-protoporphyrin O-methyltransferase